MKKFALRIFYISDANERQNQLPLGCSTKHAIFLLTVRQIRIFLVIYVRIRVARIFDFRTQSIDIPKMIPSRTNLQKLQKIDFALQRIAILKSRTYTLKRSRKVR